MIESVIAHHRSFRRNSRRRPGPDLAAVREIVSPRVWDSMRAASAQMSAAGIRHALIGGLAIGAHGYPRATTDVDFLVGAEGFVEHSGGLVTLHPALPVMVQGVLVDTLSVAPGDEHLEERLDDSPESAGVPVLALGPLVYLKLRAARRKDEADVVELLKAGADERAVRGYLREHAPELEALFDRWGAAAAEE